MPSLLPSLLLRRAGDPAPAQERGVWPTLGSAAQKLLALHPPACYESTSARASAECA